MTCARVLGAPAAEGRARRHLADLSLRERVAERGQRAARLGHDHQAARRRIQAVHLHGARRGARRPA